MAAMSPASFVPSAELSGVSETDRTVALARYHILRPFFENDVPLAKIAKSEGIAISTAWRWVRSYQKHGLPGLCRKAREDKDKPRMPDLLLQIIEGLALQRPQPSVRTVYRKVVAYAASSGSPLPSYSSVYRAVKRMEPALLTLAHQGAKVYSDTYDLLHRMSATQPNEIWQADHTRLDIWVLDDKKQPRQPWLTIILDDYSRAVY